MKIKDISPTTLAAGGVALLAVMALIAFFAFRTGDTEQNSETAQAEKAQASASALKEVPQAQVTTQQLVQNGLYTVDYKDYTSASLTDRYAFIAEKLKPEESPDTPGYMLAPQMPENVRIAEIIIPGKQLTLVAVYTNSAGFCAGKYCLFNLYVKRPQGYENYMGMPATDKSYIMVDDKSVSLIVCSEYSPDYEQWRLEDGALEKPIPANSPGHFVPVGTFKHDKIASCP